MTTTAFVHHRRAGLATLAGGVLLLAGGIASGLAGDSPGTPDGLYRSPLAHDPFVALMALGAVAQFALLLGLVALRRSGTLGASRAVTAGLGVAVAGSGLFAACQVLAALIADSAEDSTVAVVVDGAFVLASLLVVGGMLATGAGVLRAGAWEPSWRRFAPLACGVLALVVVPIQATSLLWLGVALYGAGYVGLGAALLTDALAVAARGPRAVQTIGRGARGRLRCGGRATRTPPPSGAGRAWWGGP